MKPHSHSIPNWGFLAWILIGILLFQALPGPQPLDDAYITFRYARNLHQGNGFTYNLEEKVQGTTTPLFTLLLTGISLLTGVESIPILSFSIALIADVLNIWLLYHISQKIFKNDWIAAAVSSVFLFQPLRLNVSVGGMETSLFILFLLLMYESYLDQKNHFLTGLWAALAMLTRVDAILAVFPLILQAYFKNPKTAFKIVTVSTILFLPWLIWSTLYFGNPIPHSILAKKAAYQTSSPGSGLFFLLTFLGTGTVGPYEQIWLLFPGLILVCFMMIIGLRWFLREYRESLFIVVYPILYFLTMGSQNVPLFFSWYYLPLMPGFLLLFFTAITRLSRSLSVNIRFAVLGLVTCLLIAFPTVLMKISPGWADKRQVEGMYQQACFRIKDDIPEQAVVLAPDIGMLGWCLDKAYILDPIGLVSPASLEYMDNRNPNQLFSFDLIYDQKPDYIISRDTFIPGFTLDYGFFEEYALVWEQDSTIGKVQLFQHR